MIRIPLRRPRPPEPETTGDVHALGTRLAGQIDTTLDPRSFRTDPEPVTPRQIQARVLTLFDQALATTRQIAELADAAKASAVPDHTLSALFDASAACQETLAPLIDAAMSTCPLPNEQ
ncbi:hypothetical protein [Streptantibioticus ferralitis]|uniref:Uncharacterized protein n=1 Tax=Streptantibioticus ferralitis TaxID=236510 RepID=A0ABT5ZAR8_9ACTN|nr:hypothetical protein [Streptantibioticus ferralitis]MDF2260932.1 hypothetical protein [Streptantibioticus ferralitis]